MSRKLEVPEMEDATAPVDTDGEDQYILYRIPRMEDGVQYYDEHRVKVADREKFEQEHGL